MQPERPSTTIASTDRQASTAVAPDRDDEEHSKKSELTTSPATGSHGFAIPNHEKMDYLLSRFRKANREELLKAFLKKRDALKRPNEVERYPSIRETYLALHFALNERGIMAPAFRKHLSINKYKDLSPAESLLSKDNQLIDLHYLYCQHRSHIQPSNLLYRPIFDAPEFPLDLAGELASREWRSHVKAQETLLIPPSIQMELLVLRTKQIRDKHRAINSRAEKIQTLLFERSRQPTSRLTPHSIEDHIDEFICLKLGNGSPHMALRFSCLRKGEAVPTDRAELTRLRERFRKRREWFTKNLGLKGTEFAAGDAA